MANEMAGAARRPAHVPVGAQSNDYSAQLAGVSPERFFNDAELFSRTQLLISEYFRLDAPINAAVAACHTYGRYPIAADLDELAFAPPKRESFTEFLEMKQNSR